MRLYMYHAAFVVCQKARINNLFIKEIHNFTYKKKKKIAHIYIYIFQCKQNWKHKQDKRHNIIWWLKYQSVLPSKTRKKKKKKNRRFKLLDSLELPTKRVVQVRLRLEDVIVRVWFPSPIWREANKFVWMHVWINKQRGQIGDQSKGGQIYWLIKR